MAKNYRIEEDKKYVDAYNMYLIELPDVVSEYIYSLTTSTTARTRHGYTVDLRTFYEYLKSEREDEITGLIRDISPEFLETLDVAFFDKYFNHLQYYTKDGQTYTNSLTTLKRKRSSLVSFYDYLINRDLIGKNPVRKTRRPKLRDKEVIHLDDGEMKNLVRVAESGSAKMSSSQQIAAEKNALRNSAIITLALSTGIRVSELVGLDINDINLDSCTATIIRKNEKEDTVYFSDECAEYMKEYMDYRKKIITLEGHQNALFLSNQRRRITVRAVELMVKKCANLVTSKHITPHKLRSTFGTNYHKVADIYDTAAALGHSGIGTVTKYVSRDKDKQKETRNNLPSYKN